jgi:hypothetical protein
MYFRNAAIVVALAVLGLAVAACKGPGSSVAPGGFPPITPSGDHAQYLMVANGNCGGAQAILTFNLGSSSRISSGNLSPTKNLTGAATGLNQPYVGNIDPNSNEWVANGNAPSVTSYAVLATGNTHPTHTISGAATTLSDPSGVAVSENANGANNYIYVTDYSNASIDVWPATANGNVAPQYRIMGAATGLSEPWGLTLDSQGNIWVADFAAPAVYEFKPVPNGSGAIDEAPSFTITGPAGFGPSDVYIDSSKNVWVADFSNSMIEEFAPLATTVTTRTIATASDPTGVAVDNGGNVYGAGYSSAAWIWPASTLVLGSNPAATTTITGAATNIGCATGVRVFSTSGTNDV